VKSGFCGVLLTYGVNNGFPGVLVSYGAKSDFGGVLVTYRVNLDIGSVFVAYRVNSGICGVGMFSFLCVSHSFEEQVVENYRNYLKVVFYVRLLFATLM
jgi:hypothetical protein